MKHLSEHFSLERWTWTRWISSISITNEGLVTKFTIWDCVPVIFDCILSHFLHFISLKINRIVKYSALTQSRHVSLQNRVSDFSNALRFLSNLIIIYRDIICYDIIAKIANCKLKTKQKILATVLEIKYLSKILPSVRAIRWNPLVVVVVVVVVFISRKTPLELTASWYLNAPFKTLRTLCFRTTMYLLCLP